MTRRLSHRDALAAAWILAIFAVLVFLASITGSGEGPAGLTPLAHWIWAAVATMALLVGWAVLLRLHAPPEAAGEPRYTSSPR